MTHNGPSLQDRLTAKADRTPWMASRPGEAAPDSAWENVRWIAGGVVALLIVFAMSGAFR